MMLVALSGVCCLSGLVVAVVAAVILYQRSQGGGADSSPPASTPALDSPSRSQGSPFPASASADLGRGAVGDDVDDFDEDGPTTLVDTVARRPGSLSSAPPISQSPYAPTRSRLPTEPIRKAPADPAFAPTERLQVPPRGTAAGRPPRSPQYGHVPAPDEPPPLPGSHKPAGPPPSSRRLQLDPSMMPDTSTLQPGATIIPPDDWNDDYIDDDEADETMLMARPPLPPKK